MIIATMTGGHDVPLDEVWKNYAKRPVREGTTEIKQFSDSSPSRRTPLLRHAGSS
jgi:hypothetical protein